MTTTPKDIERANKIMLGYFVREDLFQQMRDEISQALADQRERDASIAERHFYRPEAMSQPSTGTFATNQFKDGQEIAAAIRGSQ